VHPQRQSAITLRVWRQGKSGDHGEKGLIDGARSFAGNPYDGHTLAGQLEQTNILVQDLPGAPKPKTVLANLGFRGVDADVARVH
jgi:IS5 family transposase